MSYAVTHLDALLARGVEVSRPDHLTVHFHYHGAVFPVSTNQEISFQSKSRVIGQTSKSFSDALSTAQYTRASKEGEGIALD